MKELENLRKYFKQERNLENFNKMMEDTLFIVDNIDIQEVEEFIFSDKNSELYKLVFGFGFLFTRLNNHLEDFKEKIVENNIDYLDKDILIESLKMNGLNEVYVMIKSIYNQFLI